MECAYYWSWLVAEYKPKNQILSRTNLSSMTKLLIFCNTPEMPKHLQDQSNIKRLMDAIAPQGKSSDQLMHVSSGGVPGGASMDGSIPGISLLDRVVNAYMFLSRNYHPEDEIYLFGFSSGAYMARTLSDIIGAFGVLDVNELTDAVPKIIRTYQKCRNTRSKRKREKLERELAPWLFSNSPGKTRMNHPNGSVEPFPVTCLVLFEDATMSVMSDKKRLWSRNPKDLFGCPDPYVGDHVQYVYQAFALHEIRYRSPCNKLRQTEVAKQKGQILKQCWFSGDRLDIGGGRENRDLADLVLFWMAANISNKFIINVDYLKSHLKPVSQWGIYVPDNAKDKRPQKYSFGENDTIHESVLEQPYLDPDLRDALNSCQVPVEQLQPLEKTLKYHDIASNKDNLSTEID